MSVEVRQSPSAGKVHLALGVDEATALLAVATGGVDADESHLMRAVARLWAGLDKARLRTGTRPPQ